MQSTQSNPWRVKAVAGAVIASLYAPCVFGAHAYLEDVQYDGRRAQLSPLNHEFPRKVLTESKGMPRTAEAISKWDGVAVNAYQMSSAVAAAQQLNPNLLIFKQFLLGGFQGSTLKDDCTNAFAPAFGSVGSATSGCSFYAGHWAYYAGTTLSGSISASTLIVSVADGKRITPGKYVVIYDAPAGSFRNAEHALVKSVSGDVVTLSARGFKSTPSSHAIGSIIAEHPVAAGTDGAETAGHWLYNLSSVCPKDANGNRLSDVFQDWLASNYRKDSRGNNFAGRVDGILFDTDPWSFSWRDRLDINNDLVPDGGWSANAGSNYWGDGLEQFYQGLRERLPELILIGGTRNTRGFDALSGVQMEGWPVSGSFFSPTPAYKVVDELLANYHLQLQEGPEHLAAYTENLNKTPSRTYPDGASPTPTSNAAFRFSLGTTLLGDGYYGEEPTAITPDPWYDEFAVDVNPSSPNYGRAVLSDPNNESLTRLHSGWLGMPLGAPRRIYDDQAFSVGRSLMSNGDLDTSAGLVGWRGVNVNVTYDNATSASGAGSLRVSNHLVYASKPASAVARSPKVRLVGGVDYTLVFAIKSQKPRGITVGIAGQTQGFLVPDYWVRRVVNFTPQTSGDYTISFNLGQEDIPVWLDDVYVFEGTTNVFMREFESGAVVVNGTAKPRSVELGETFLRIKGTGQDPINDGTEVTRVTVGAYDAAFLVRPLPEAIVASVEDLAVAEGAGHARFRILLSAAPTDGRSVSLRFVTENGTAAAGEDYSQQSGTLTFLKGEREKLVSVPIHDDSAGEGDETFRLTLRDPVNLSIGRGSGTGTILDDDRSILVGDATAVETDGFLMFHAKISTPPRPGEVVKIAYSTENETAIAGKDYVTQSGWVTFSDNQTEAFISIPLIDDTVEEAAETFWLRLSEPVNVRSSGGSIKGTILDDDEPAQSAPPTINLCGAPAAGPSTDAGLFLWEENCGDTTGNYVVRAWRGGRSGGVRYEGQVTSSQGFSGVKPFAFESNDVLEQRDGGSVIRYGMTVSSPWQDGFSFSAAKTANLCFGVDLPAGTVVRVGPSAKPVAVPFDLATLEACKR